MTQRVGINEAETVILGQGGRSQQIPVLETLDDGTHIPGKTTVADLLNALSGDGAQSVEQVKRFFITTFNNSPILASAGQGAGTRGGSTLLQFVDNTTSLISGSNDFFRLDGFGIRLPQAGAYRIDIELSALRTGPVEDRALPLHNVDFIVYASPEDAYTYTPGSLQYTAPTASLNADGTLNFNPGNVEYTPGTLVIDFNDLQIDDSETIPMSQPLLSLHAFVPTLTIRGTTSNRNIIGTIQPPIRSTGAVLVPFMQSSFFFIANGPVTPTFSVDMLNVGATSNDTSDTSWSITPAGTTGSSTITISLIA